MHEHKHSHTYNIRNPQTLLHMSIISVTSVHGKTLMKVSNLHEVSAVVSIRLLYVDSLLVQAIAVCLDAGLTSSNSVRRDLDLKHD